LPHIIWYQQFLVATDLLLFVISTINFENPKNSPKFASNFDLKICWVFNGFDPRISCLKCWSTFLCVPLA
jgi:hypothetical protein